MRTIKIKVYRFKELKKDVQEKVLGKMRTEGAFFDNENIKDDLTNLVMERLKEEGISQEGLKVMYSLSSCQGDGLCFIGRFEFGFGKKRYTAIITHNYRYFFANSVSIVIEDEEGNEPKNYEKIEAFFKECYLKICKEAEKQGYADIDYQDSDKVIKECIEANDYWFRKNGEISRGE